MLIANMRLHGLLARSLLLSPNWANASSHFCSTSPSLLPNPGGRALSESNLNSKPPSPLAGDKRGSSGVAISKSRGGSFEVKRSKEAKSKGKPSPSQAIASADIAKYNGISGATESSIKPKWPACIEEDPIHAVKPKRPNKDFLPEILENGDDANDSSILAKRVAPAKKTRKPARQGGHTIPFTECSPLHFKGKTRMQSQAGAEISAHSAEIQTLPKAKPSRKSSKIHAKAKASAVSEGVPNVSTVPDVDGDANGEYAKAAAGIPEASSILGENPGLQFLDVQASEKPFVNVQGPPNQDVTIEARHLFDELPVRYKVEITSEDGDAAGPTFVKESKKASLLVAFPIKILSRWWMSCYERRTVAFNDLTEPLKMTHVWVAAYQRAFSKRTGKYCDGETIQRVIEKLRDLQFTVARGKFKWADQKHVHLPPPITDTDKTSKTSSEVFISSAFQDDVVEEVLLLVLEPIFEARFSARSHAFRPERDAHTALCMVRRSFQGCAWFISGEVSSQRVYPTRVLDSVMRVVRDMWVASLVKSFLRDKWTEMEMEEVDKAGMGSNRDLSMRLKFLLWNVFLDQLDQWMEKRIHSLSERKQLIFRSSSNLLFRADTITARKTPKMEYVRYGTNILVGFYGSQKEAETLREDCLGFLHRGMGVNLDRNELLLLHISSEVKFLDHIISQKVVHPIVSRRSASNGRIFEKRALRIRLFLKASRQTCLSYLNQIGSPASLEEIKEILAILNNWYLYAEDRVKTTEYCKLFLCRLYVKEVLGEQQRVQKNKAFRKSVEAMRMALDDPVKEKDLSSDRGKFISKDGIWLPEHEMILKELAWLQSEVAMIQVAKDFRHKSTLSPQQQTVQVVWDFLKGSYPFRGDYIWEPETWVQLPSLKEGRLADLKSEELSECAV